MKKTPIIKWVLLTLLLYFGNSFQAKAFFERIIIGKDTLCLVENPLQADSTLSAKVQERLSGAYSTACRRGYQGVWRLENDTLFLEKIVDYCNLTKSDAKEVVANTDGIFDAYKQGGRIVASWYSGELKVLGGKCINEQGAGFLGRFEREWIYQVSNGRVTSRQVFQNSFKKASFPKEQATQVITTLFNRDRFPELTGKSLFFKAAVTPHANGTIDKLDIEIAIESKDSMQHKYSDTWKWIKNDFSNPYVQELKTCLELIPDWDYFVINDEVQPVRLQHEIKGEQKGYSVYQEENNHWGHPRRDMLTWNDTTYFFPGHPLQYDTKLYARLRPFLKNDFSLYSWRGYTARWEIRDGYLFLLSLHHAKDDSPIPLNTIFKDNKGEPVKATWFTGTLLLPDGDEIDKHYSPRDNSIQDNYLRTVHENEIFCDVKKGKIGGRTVYRNFLKEGDAESLDRREQEIAYFAWDKYPELKGKQLHCLYTIQPRMDGTLASIRVEIKIEGLGQEAGRVKETISDPAHPLVIICRESLDKVTTWDVLSVRGRIEPVFGSIYDRRRTSGLNIDECSLKNFTITPQGPEMLRIIPKNHEQIVWSLNSKIERYLPYKEDSTHSKPWETFRKWKEEITNRCIPVEVSEIVRRKENSKDRYSHTIFEAFLLIDQTGKVYSVFFIMSDNLFLDLTEVQLQSMYDSFMREKLLTITPLLDFGDTSDLQELGFINYGILEFNVDKRQHGIR